MINVYSIYDNPNAFIVVGNHFTKNEILSMFFIHRKINSTESFKISDISYGWGTVDNLDFIIQENKPSNFENKVTFINFIEN